MTEGSLPTPEVAPPVDALEVRGLFAGYGVMTVVDGVGLRVAAGEMVALVGRNGVGKSTLLHALAGFRHGGNAGAVVVAGQDITRLRPHQVLRHGLALVPEGHRVFPELTVEENLLMGAFLIRKGVFLQRRFAGLERVFELFPVIASMRAVKGSTLSGGQQQMVAVGQALMAGPRCLLLDEPAAGLAPKVAEELYHALHRLADDGMAVLVVDQDVSRALRHSHRTYVMEAGRVVREGVSADLDENELIQVIVRGVAS